MVCATRYNENTKRRSHYGRKKSLMHNLISELRRGTLILSVLSHEFQRAKYGYANAEPGGEKGVEIGSIPCIRCFAGWRSRGI